MNEPNPTLRVETRQYKSKAGMNESMKAFLQQGWIVQASSTTTSRRMIGCLFGLIGYWLLPKKTVWHVTYVLPPNVPLTPPPPEDSAPPRPGAIG